MLVNYVNDNKICKIYLEIVAKFLNQQPSRESPQTVNYFVESSLSPAAFYISFSSYGAFHFLTFIACLLMFFSSYTTLWLL